ncbi:hypothetical protein [Chryseobacterium fistulae]|uniref:hypothetical protein n=1 Tax=Chryseobacterium fistulae TaxID=2675058 RepID=UPI00138A4B4F|nr:hypothetical protein [Chryseobacterium fistulae]
MMNYSALQENIVIYHYKKIRSQKTSNHHGQYKNTALVIAWTINSQLTLVVCEISYKGASAFDEHI